MKIRRCRRRGVSVARRRSRPAEPQPRCDVVAGLDAVRAAPRRYARRYPLRLHGR